MSELQLTVCATALELAKNGEFPAAEAIIGQLIADNFDLKVSRVEINQDQFSLNSINGFVKLVDGQEYFFKFHHEEGEEQTLEELYRGEQLQHAGYPVDVPIYAEKVVGRQILLYRKREDRRFFDLCRSLEDGAGDIEPAVAAQRDLDAHSLRIYRETLHAADPGIVAGEAIHQLFYYRLTDSRGRSSPNGAPVIGARAKRFFWNREFAFPGLTLSADELRTARWVINGVEYDGTIETLLHRSLQLLNPASLCRFGAVTAHGDAHNANVWWIEQGARPELVFFDPAFAGTNVPALLAEVKATFHNIFAHPYWLYHPDVASARYRASAAYIEGALHVRHDWSLSPLRKAFLRVKVDELWVPLLLTLRSAGLLPTDWLETLRCALFCCPTLVMDLCAGGSGGHTPESSLIGLSVAMAVGAPSQMGSGDDIAWFFERLESAVPSSCV